MNKPAIAIVVIGLIVTVAGALNYNRPPPPAEPVKVAAKAAPEWDKSPAAQAKRRAAIQQLVNAGVIRKYSAEGGVPRVYVGPEFSTMDFDDKRNVMHVVYTYFFERAYYLKDRVLLVDVRTNKTIGDYGVTLNGLALILD
jgi:hypothetical protein